MSLDLPLDETQAWQLYRSSNGEELFRSAAAARRSASRNSVELCAIVNVKSGRCSENCAFCAQSVHYQTDSSDRSLAEKDIVAYAKTLQSYGVKRFSLVSSGRGVSDGDLEKFLSIYRVLKAHTHLSLCASHGIITLEQARRLKENGVTRYHHNLETAESYFPTICTTHTYRERLSTIRIAMQAGLEICSGGIIGLGEKMKDRIELAMMLQKLGVKSIPLNVLMPVAGTPLENNTVTGAAELLETVSLFRCINPSAKIRFAGGRPLFDFQTQVDSLKYGFDALMIGDYLTRKGMDIGTDIENINNNGLYIE